MKRLFLLMSIILILAVAITLPLTSVFGAAQFKVSDLNISPTFISAVSGNSTITISVKVANTSSESGTYKLELKINDTTEATKDVSLEGGKDQTVIFPVTRKDVGDYNVSIENLKGVFSIAPAALDVKTLLIDPLEPSPGKDVTISVTVQNKSTDQPLTYDSLKLYVNGANVDKKRVELKAGDSTTITFTVSKSEPGNFVVNVGPKTGTFTVKSSFLDSIFKDPLTIIIIIIVLLIVIMVVVLLISPKKRGKSMGKQVPPKKGQRGPVQPAPMQGAPGPQGQQFQGPPQQMAPHSGQMPQQQFSPQQMTGYPGQQQVPQQGPPAYQPQQMPPQQGPQFAGQPQQPMPPQGAPPFQARPQQMPPQPGPQFGGQAQQMPPRPMVPFPGQPQQMSPQSMPQFTGQPQQPMPPQGAPPFQARPQQMPPQPGPQFGGQAQQMPPRPMAPFPGQPQPMPPQGAPPFQARPQQMSPRPTQFPMQPQQMPGQKPGFGAQPGFNPQQQPGYPSTPVGMQGRHAPPFTVSNLNITPQHVKEGDTINISAVVTNNTSSSGQYSMVLRIGGVVENISELTLNANSSQTALFTIVRDTPGDYYVEVDGQRGAFTVARRLPAAFNVSNLTITPERVKQGEPITISTIISNSGETTGNYSVVLRIKGIAESIEEVELGPGRSQKVVFTITKDAAGFYPVALENLTGKFVVEMDWKG